MTVIRPKTNILQINLREVWQYRDLIVMLVKRNYQIQYKQTILGPAWMILGILFSSGLFSLVFGYVGRFSSDGMPYYMFYLSGSVIWSLLSGCFHSNQNVFMENAYLMGKVYFPRLALPVANIVSQLIRFLLQMGVCMAVWTYYYLKGEVFFTGGYLLFVIPMALIASLLGASLGLIISSMTVKYRDLKHMVGFLMQLLMYASPVLYPVSQVPDWLRLLVLFNPVTGIISTFRYALTGQGDMELWNLGYSAVATGIILFAGVVMFNQSEKDFIDII